MKMNLKMPFLGMLIFLIFGMASEVKAQTLSEYLRIAAENNPEVKAAYSDFEAAMQEVPQVKSLPDPNLTMTAFGSMVETRLGPQEARFSLMQMFPWFGTLSAKADVATLMAEAKFQEFLDARNELFFQVSEQYYKLYELEQSLVFQRDNLEILQNYKDLALSRVRAGSGALSDVLQVDLMRNDAETNLEILQLKKQPLLAKFNALLNREKLQPVIIPVELDIAIDPQLIAEVAVENNPKLAQLEKMSESAQAQKEVAKKSGMPMVGLGLDYVIVGKRTDMVVEDNGRDAIMPMLSVSLPIFRKKYKAAQKQAEFMAESYSQRKVGVENRLKAEMEEALFQVQQARAMLNLYEKQVESSNQVLNLLLSSYKNAASDFEEVLRVRQELLKYQLAVAGAEAELLTAVAKINYLTGKSFEYENEN
ncbi:TolC family protein [Salinimicrobium soli]|uniref:TolC family protein n=1 Tax=Salinimicrobium soli TaxID=1254399 RepID=UPI003AAE2B68